MRRGYKRRRGLIAMAAAFVLVVLLSIPALAVDSSAVSSSGTDTSYNVYVNGIFILQDDSVLAQYFEYDTVYEIESGTFSVYEGSTLVKSNLSAFKVVAAASPYTFQALARNSSEFTNVFVTTDSTYATAEFDNMPDRYIVFDNCTIKSDSEIYDMLVNCAAATSTVVISSSVYYSNSIVDVIVDGFNGIITGLGSGVADFFQTLFIANDGTGNLSTFAIVSLVFIGVAVAFGIARWIIKKVGQ